MNKMLLSTAKVAVLFSVSTFFAYMILKTQIKSSSKRTKPAVAVKQTPKGVGKVSDTTEPVLTYVSSTKAETSDINLSVDDLDVTYFDSSKAGPIGEVIISPNAFAEEKGKKKYVELEKEIEPKEFFHTSKAVLTTVALENVETNEELKELPEKDIYFPASKAAPVDFDFKTEGGLLTEAEDLQVRIFELEYEVKKLKAKIAKLKNSGK